MSDDPPFIVVGGRGRPPRAGVRATRQLHITVTVDEHTALQQVASENRMKLASVIREAVNSFVADYADKVVFLPSGDKFRK